MIKSLKLKLDEANKPVGRKALNNWKLPPADFAYGKKEKEDEFHAGASNIYFKFIINFLIVTNSWVTHKESKPRYPPAQDFVRINKLAITQRAFNFHSNKEFRKNVNIKQKIKRGSKSKKIYLPPDEFVYGKRNR